MSSNLKMIDVWALNYFSYIVYIAIVLPFVHVIDKDWFENDKLSYMKYEYLTRLQSRSFFQRRKGTVKIADALFSIYDQQKIQINYTKFLKTLCMSWHVVY